MKSTPRLLASPHTAPLLILAALIIAYWGKVLFTSQVLLPGAFLGGFAPFGSNPQAPWNILQWDSLAQYYPWRFYAGQQLIAGLLPLWNPHQFAGAPLMANGQSAVFYPLNLPFWLFDTARAFGLSAALHTALACYSTYFLMQHWRLSRAASLLAAIVFGFCGYLAAWVMLPTLANTASWLPLLLLLFERATATPRTPKRLALLGLALCCTLLAGHAQIFFYCLVALTLRALTLSARLQAIKTFTGAFMLALALGALQLLPTLELARLGHRAAQGGASAAGWEFVRAYALPLSNLPSLVVPYWPFVSFNENIGYVGFGALLLGVCAAALGLKRGTVNDDPPPTRATESRSALIYALVLTVFGLLYALATPLAQALYFTVPGLAQMGNTGRAFVLWSLGVALLAAFGLDALRTRWNSPALPTLALVIITVELFAATWNMQPTAPRESIYPATKLTAFLQSATRDGSRVLFLTPRGGWQPSEAFSAGRTHPPGVLPPNGALVYGLFDVNGYDSLAPLAYRNFVASGEGAEVSPQYNGNMILLNNPASPALDALSVRHIVSETTLPQQGEAVFVGEGVYVYQRRLAKVTQKSGRDFSPGWREGQYQPESFRFGGFLSLCAIGLVAAIMTGRIFNQKSQ